MAFISRKTARARRECLGPTPAAPDRRGPTRPAAARPLRLMAAAKRVIYHVVNIFDTYHCPNEVLYLIFSYFSTGRYSCSYSCQCKKNKYSVEVYILWVRIISFVLYHRSEPPP